MIGTAHQRPTMRPATIAVGITGRNYAGNVDVRPVDPRDTERAEYDPVYRIYFWERLSYPGIPAELTGYKCSEYELVGAADVREVLSWAEENAGPDQTFTVYAMLDRREIRLFGRDPTRSSDS